MQAHLKKWYLPLIAIILVGIGYFLGTLHYPKVKTETSTLTKAVEPTPTLHPVVHDKNFEEILKTKNIYLVAPSSSISLEKIKQLQSLKQFNIVIPENTFSNAIIFHSNSDENRLQLLKNILLKPSKDTILWGLRGGYGSARLLPELNKLQKPAQKKIFIGYSDATALHLFLSQHWGWQTIHGAFLAELLSHKKDPKNFQKIAEMLENKKGDFSLDNLKPYNSTAQKQNKISGRLTGGNLTVVETSIGTDWQIDGADKIIFLEDVDVKGYQVDRSLNHLKQAGVFKNAKAIVLGDFIEADEHVKLALSRFAEEIGVPVFKTDTFGHGKVNYPLVYNAPADIIFDKNSHMYNLIMHIDLP
jgi:muramoyltetrapeptide carboxypeptidase